MNKILKAILDQLLTKLEAKEAYHPVVLAALEYVQKQADALLDSGTLDAAEWAALAALLAKLGITLPPAA